MLQKKNCFKGELTSTENLFSTSKETMFHKTQDSISPTLAKERSEVYVDGSDTVHLIPTLHRLFLTPENKLKSLLDAANATRDVMNRFAFQKRRYIGSETQN